VQNFVHKGVPMRKTLRYAVCFAMFAERFGIPPVDLAEMVRLANQSINAWKRNDNKKENKYADKVKAIAEKYGCTVSYAGLVPWIGKAGQPESLLPCQS
jgi:uncharacterized protein YjcR